MWDWPFDGKLVSGYTILIFPAVIFCNISTGYIYHLRCSKRNNAHLGVSYGLVSHQTIWRMPIVFFDLGNHNGVLRYKSNFQVSSSGNRKSAK